MLALLLFSCVKPPASVDAAAEACSADAIYEAYLDALTVTREATSVSTWYARATMSLSSMAAPIITEIWWLGPDLHVTRSTIPGAGAFEQAWDGSVGWAVELGSARLLSDDELRSYRAEAAMTLDNRGIYDGLTCVGQSDFDGESAWELVGQEIATGATIHTWYAPDTGLQVGHRTHTADGAVTTVFLREYTDYGGVLWPSRMESELGAGGTADYVVEEIILDPTPPELSRPEGL